MTADEKKTVIRALVALARARRAEFEHADQLVYVRVLEDLTCEMVVTACGVLAASPRPEYGSAMPSAGDIRREVGTIAARRREQHEAAQRARLLPEGPPVSAERVAALRADVARRVEAMRMTAAGERER